MANKLVLHGLSHSRSLRIVWLLELLGLDYQLIQHQREKTLFAPESLKNIFPLGKAPILQDGELTLAESGAIVDYLIQTYGNGHFMPKKEGVQHYWQYQRWLHYAEASLMPFILMGLVFSKIEQVKQPFFVRPIAKKISQKTHSTFLNPQVQLHLSHINQVLGENKWLMGDEITGADVMLSFPLQAVHLRYDISSFANIQRYLAQIEQDSAYNRAVEKAGKPLNNS